MDRRGAWAGVTLLIVAALVIMVPVLLRPREFDGLATAAPMPEPPQVGDCLAFDRRAIVSCEGPHYSEVTARWSADDPQRWVENASGDGCEVAARDYMDFPESPVADWYIFVNSRAERVDAPLAERVRTRGWTICTVTVSAGGTYSGSLRNVTPSARPAETGICVVAAAQMNVGCSQPHDQEFLASTWQTVPDPDGSAAPLLTDGSWGVQTDVLLPVEVAASIDAQCAHIASIVLDSPDPTRGGVLSMQTRPMLFGAAPDEPGMAMVAADCLIRSADGRQLVGSLIGLGDAAPTFG